MDRTQHPLAAWLGPALDELTDDHLDRFTVEVERIDERFPDPDEQPYRDAAMSAAVQYLLGETQPADAARALEAARTAVTLATRTSEQIAMMAVADGATEDAAAKAAGISRATLRTAMGK